MFILETTCLPVQQLDVDSNKLTNENIGDIKTILDRLRRELPQDVNQGLVESVNNQDTDDLEVAEVHIFRPLFRYRAQLAERRRIRDADVIQENNQAANNRFN